MFKIIRKYKPAILLIVSLSFLYFISIVYFPFIHNLDSDFNPFNTKTLVILEGKHNHKDNPESPCFDFHRIKLINVGDCLICTIFGTFRFIFSNQVSSFFHEITYLFSCFEYFSPYVSKSFNLPLLRAPPHYNN